MAKLASQFTEANNEWLSRADEALISVADISWTVLGWLYNDDESDDHSLIAKWLPTGDQREDVLKYNDAFDRMEFRVSPDGTSTGIGDLFSNNFGAMSTATWYFVVGEHNASANTIRVGVNDTFNSEAYTTGAADKTGELTIGANDGGTTGTDHSGRLDNVAFWKRVLTTAELTWLYNSGNGRAYEELGQAGNDGANLLSSLICWWDLDETSGTRADSHFNGLTLTDNNTVTGATGIIEEGVAIASKGVFMGMAV